MGDVAAVLRALADLAPGDREQPDTQVDVAAGDQPFLWLGLEADPGTLFTVPRSVVEPVALPMTFHGSEASRRLQGFDALHREEQLLRCGWIFLCGTAVIDGRQRRLCLPLVQRPVRLRSPMLFGPEAHQLGDVLTLGGQAEWPEPSVAWGVNPSEALLSRFTGMKQWINAATAAAGFPPVTKLLGPEHRPEDARGRSDLVAVVGYGIYVDRLAPPSPRASSLREWADRNGIDRSAFAALYDIGVAAEPREADDGELVQPLPLTAAQEEVVRRARAEVITVVSGAPGNGKSHTVCAVAIDAVARGDSVLVVTPTSFAADVLGDLLARHPGPQPVLFGETEGRRRMLSDLEVLGRSTVGDAELARRREHASRASETRRAAEAEVVAALDRELRADRAARGIDRVPELRNAVPAVFAPGADLDDVRRRLAAAGAGWRWWRGRQLRRLVGCPPIVGLDVIAEAVEAAADIRAELSLDRAGGTTIAEAWPRLLAAELDEAQAAGSLVDGLARSADRWSSKGRRAVAALARALPAGRATRRDLLADLDAPSLVRALPLWIGTLRDVEDLLPARPGLFDVVVVDEAAQVDQFRAAGSLLRASRAVIVGDPRQLRHVSFISDDSVATTLARYGLSRIADRLDVRRQSLYDVAAGAAPVTFLDEHHRSVPHLIDFSARRFYDGYVRVATRHPTNESVDAVDLVRVPDVAAEVAAVVEVIAELVDAGATSIGAISPFRDHADAIETAVLDRFEPEVIDAYGVRTGTAHSFQGSERDVVVVALGLALDDPAGRWRFAEDPNLFNVLVTRARRRMVVVTGLPSEGVPRGVVADYLRHAERPPSAPVSGAAPTSWTAALAGELSRNGIAARVGYPVGRWTVDICAGEGEQAVALDCGVHPAGPDAHLDRHRALARAGWRTLDAFPSRWDDDAARAAVELAEAIRSGH